MRAPLLDSHADEYKANPEFNGHLGAALVRALAQCPSRVAQIDRTGERKSLRAGALLGIASLLAERFKKIPEKRVGIVLPPGLGGTLANLALELADKSPVNLNFTAGSAAVASCIRQSKLKTIVSAEAMRVRLPNFPWKKAEFLDIVAALKSFSKFRLATRIARVFLSSPESLIRRWGVPTRGGDAEAGLLFTSGSSGDPKGVPLTHRNILGQVHQIEEFGLLEPGDRILGCLPLFHSFGFTVTLWLGLLMRLPVVTVASPFDLTRILSSIREEKVTILIGSPTFLRPYFKRAKAHSIPSVRIAIAGAEKTPAGFAEQWESFFDCPYCEGYGLTETTPVVGVNMPPSPRRKFGEWNRRGSIGRPLPGQDIRIVDPDTGEDLKRGEQGLLHIKGVNVFNGYLDNPEATAAVLQDGWFNTGDLARLDEDGFLHIDGRLSRFSKVGGEKVSHSTVETKIMEALGLAPGEGEIQPLAVAGRRDPVKGESLVLVSAVDIDMNTLRERLAAAGIPNLWIPRVCKRVEKLPLMATGKLDLKTLNKLAEEA